MKLNVIGNEIENEIESEEKMEAIWNKEYKCRGWL